MALEALPARPGTALEAPPTLPRPPSRTRVVSLVASPVWPELATALPWAPVLAPDRALPVAVASPVLPESPEDAFLPDASPVEPDDPDRATGAADPVDAAHPVSPLLVADDWAVASPDRPVMAVGITVTLTDPPLPPLASPMGTELAVTTPRAEPPAATVAPVATPPLPDLADAAPPGPAPPPVATTRVLLTASPVRPDVALEVESAPVLAVESATPLAEASPVEPEPPEPPRLPLASPVSPDEPEVASGVELAAELADPVFPVLVADD